MIDSKAENPIQVTTKKKIIAKSKKKTRIKRKKAFTVRNPQGKLTFKRLKGNKKITINKTTGLITVKKGMKPKTYSVKIRVNAAGTGNYNAGYKDVTIKIKVK